MDISKVSGAWNFALRSRSIIGHFLHHTWPEHSYTPLDASKPQTYILFIYMLSDTSSRYPRTIQANSKHHQTPTDTKRHQQTSPDTQKGRSRIVLTWNGVCWCLMVSDDVLYCLMLSADVRRVSEKFFKGYLSAVYGFI